MPTHAALKKSESDGQVTCALCQKDGKVQELPKTEPWSWSGLPERRNHYRKRLAQTKTIYYRVLGILSYHAKILFLTASAMDGMTWRRGFGLSLTGSDG